MVNVSFCRVELNTGATYEINQDFMLQQFFNAKLGSFFASQ